LKKPIQFGKYYLLDRVNVGGMAEVFKAKAFGVEGFERLLAVKRILPNIAEDEEFITMFIDEAKIAVQLNHANICQIFDLGKVEDSYFIALEFVHGKDVRAIFDRCKQKPVDGSTAMPIAQAAFIVMKACEGLDYAHNKRDPQGHELQLVHRDVSPQNILISYEGEVKLIDFGIAKAAGKMSKTQQGILKGKFGYMSPEQVRGLPLDRRSDIFSLGIVLYELLTGERLFVGESDFSTLEKVRNVEILPPSTYNRRISDELERIVMKALAKDVDDRYQNAIDLHDDLQAFMYTAGEFYSRKDLAAWMKKVFAAEIEAESAKLESYRQMPAPELARPAAPAATAAPGERPRRNSIPPPPPVPARISGQHPVIAAPPPTPAAAAPAVRANGTAPSADGARVGAPDLGWDDEELATNIYDQPPDAADQVVEDTPDLSDIELSSDGEPVPHSSVASGLPSSGQLSPLPASLPAPPLPAHDHGRNGSARGNGFDFVLPEPTASPFSSPTADMVARPRPKPKTRAPLFIVGAVVLTVAVASTMGVVYYLGNKPGEVVITSEPAVNVQVLVDNKRMNVDGTPATLKLEPGSYVLTVQREGYVPWTEQVEVKAGERVAKRVVLEALAAGTGFALYSDPPGAHAFLDGKALDGLTPLKVQSVVPGKHTVEVKSSVGVWTQDVVIEAGKIIDVRAAIVPAAPPAPVIAQNELPAKPPAAAKPSGDGGPPPKHVKRERDEVRPVVNRDLPRLEAKAKQQPKKDDDEVSATPALAPKSEKERTADKAPAGEGYLRLGSKPWANIAVDGKDTGLHTPQIHLKLGAGSHRITLTNPQFSIKETFTVEIKSGETETVTKKYNTAPAGGDDSD
jgi:serine/threonine protein kinase